MKKTKQILMLIESSTSYGRGFMRGIARFAREQSDWEFTIQPRGMNDPPPSLARWRGDGVISRLSDRRSADAVAALSCPVVELLLDDHVPVFGDDDAIAGMTLDRFETLGFEHFAFFSFGGCFWVRHRGDSFAAECRRRSLDFDRFEPARCELDQRPEPIWREPLEKPLDLWLQHLRKPTAILCANDHQAIRLLNACRRLGLAVPDSVAICGVNNDEHLCEIVAPTLSSVDQNAERIGYEAARLLDLKMNNRPTTDFPKKIAPSKLIERESTDAFLTEDADFCRAWRFIRRRAVEGIRVADVLAEFDLTDKTLERWFKKRFGHTPEREIIMTRLKKATELLETTNDSLRKIAERAGFSSERYFSQAFRREIGISPHRWREKQTRSDS